MHKVDCGNATMENTIALKAWRLELKTQNPCKNISVCLKGSGRYFWKCDRILWIHLSPDIFWFEGVLLLF